MLAQLIFVCYSLNVAKLQKEMDDAEEVYKLLFAQNLLNITLILCYSLAFI